MSALSDEELRDKTTEFRERLGVEGADITHGQSFAAGLGEETEEMAMQRAEEKEREAQRAPPSTSSSPRRSRSCARRRSARSACATSTCS